MTKAADVTLTLANGSRAVSHGTCLVNVDIQQYSGTVELLVVTIFHVLSCC